MERTAESQHASVDILLLALMNAKQGSRVSGELAWCPTFTNHIAASDAIYRHDALKAAGLRGGGLIGLTLTEVSSPALPMDHFESMISRHPTHSPDVMHEVFDAQSSVARGAFEST